MIFKGINNQSIQLNIINYEFPDYIDELYVQFDSNWLIVNIKVLSNFGIWEATDPALLTSDFQQMINWFDNLSKNNEPNTTELIFTEPIFLLFLENSHNDMIKKIRIQFEAEFKLKGYDQDCFIEIHANNEELSRISNELRKELSKFPAR
jgi:hypothetical protein